MPDQRSICLLLCCLFIYFHSSCRKLKNFYVSSQVLQDQEVIIAVRCFSSTNSLLCRGCKSLLLESDAKIHPSDSLNKTFPGNLPLYFLFLISSVPQMQTMKLENVWKIQNLYYVYYAHILFHCKLEFVSIYFFQSYAAIGILIKIIPFFIL